MASRTSHGMTAAVRGGQPTEPVSLSSAALVAMWLMTLIIFSVPNRVAPEGLSDLDPIAITKVLARLASMAVLGLAILRSWRGDAQHRLVAWTVLPLALYTAFAVVSTAWSPLKAVTLGQAGGLLVMCLLTTTLAMTCRSEADARVALRHLAFALLFVSGLLLVAHAIDPSFSGLNRDPREWDGSLGMLHPTAAGATASLGITVLVGSWLLWAWPWTTRLLLPGSLVHLVVLNMAKSRTADAMLLLVLAIMFLTLVPRSWFGVVVVAACGLTAVYIALDPALDGLAMVFASGVEYASRGETAQTMSTLTGRTELWAKIWESFLQAPVLGHGYFVSSSTGVIDVWSGPANRTAHNVMLQALVTTGVVGTALFVWGLWRPMRLLVYARGASRHVVHAAFFALLIGVWFLGWGQLSESILGPVRPESVVFFSTLGIAIGQLSTAATRRAPAEAAA